MKHTFRLVLTMMLVASILASLAPETAAAQDPPPDVPTAQPANGALDRVFDALAEKARSNGRVPVIAKLEMVFVPEGKLTSQAEINHQQDSIAQMQTALLDQLPVFGVSNIKQFRYIPYIALTVDEATLRILQSAPQVAGIEEDIAVPPTLSESVPLIGGNNAWAAGYTGSGWAVAILDTGVNKTHSFLSGKVVSEACYSTSDWWNGASSVCPNGSDSQVGRGAGVNCPTNISGCNHGTHVAGIAAGKGSSFSGIAKDANVIAIQVFHRVDNSLIINRCGDSPSPCLNAYASDIIRGLERVYALRNTYNIAAVNMSLGGGRYTSYCDSDSRKAIIDNLRSAGIATVIASGNEEYTDALSAPACISTAVSVGATTKSDSVSSYSNSAFFLKLLAPGSSIYSSIPGGGYDSLDGTSMATPHVTGAWAVLKQRSPSASVDQILTALETTGVSITDPRNNITKPRIQVDAAANVLCPPPSGGVVLYKHSGYNCNDEISNRGYVRRTSTGWQNVGSWFNNQASSIRIPSGWSVKLYEQNDRGGGWACRTANDDNFWGDQFNNGVSLNDQVSSFEVFSSSNCGINRPPNTPLPQSPGNGYVSPNGQTPTLCWNNPGDPDGDQLQFYAEAYGGPVNANSGWIYGTCWWPNQLNGNYYNYQWHVKARDSAGTQSSWSTTWHFAIESPNQSPTIAFNTANGNLASLIESREQNWAFQGTASDPDGSVNRVELRCSGDNCGSGATQASGTTSWSLARSAMAGRSDVYFQVYDNQGASATSRHLDLRIDLAAPTTGNNLIGTAGSNGWHTSPVEVRLHADDGSTGGARVGVDRVVYRLDGGTWQNRSGSDVSLVVNGDGTHTVDYYAVDKVGNAESQKQVTFKIDATLPSAPGTATEIHGVLSGQWQRGLDDPSFIWAAADGTVSGIWYYRVNWNNTLQVTQGSAYDPPAVRTGSYALSVQAVDQAGNVGPAGATFTFRYDGTPPPAPAIQNHDGVASGVWQNSIRTPNFSWPTPNDQGSGVAGYNRYWGPDASGESSTLVTGNTFVSATPICAENEAATYYLRLRTQDGVGWQSEWVGYALAYDGAPPNATLVANYGQPVAHQTSVHLDIAASDQGSGVAQMRLSNSGYNWSAWMPPTSELYWEIPAIGRREHAIYLQLVDGAGNVSDIISDTVYFDVNVPFPKSENFHMWDSLLAAGGGIITSTNLIQRVTIGQPSESVALQSAQYLLNPGFQAGALAAPIQVPTYTTYMQLGSLMASATTSATAITSGHFRLYGSLGQPSDMRTVTSTNFTASLGFWAGAANDVTPEPPEPPEPLPPPECEFYNLSINNGALFTRSPLVTLNLCGPDPVQMMLSNDGGFSGATWQPYSQTVSWTLTTYGNYVLPRLAYARYRDGNDAIHGNFFDDIIYDPGAPEGAVAFDAATLLPDMKLQAASQPLRVTSTPDTELFLSFTDDSSGMAEVQISLTPDFADATWQPYAGITPVTFTEEGVQTVYVRTRDQAGNTSAVVTDTLIVDTTPPLGRIQLAEDVVGSNTLTLTALLPAWDYVSDVSDVRISTLESFGDALWQPYAPEVTVPISYTGIAQPLLYAQFRDAAGNVSATYTTTYLVDTTPPVLYVEVAPGDTLTRTLNILVYDELSRIGEMRLSNDPLFLEGVVTLPHTQTVTWAFDARRVVWVQIADSVGNFSEPFPAYAHEGAAILESKVYLPLVLRQQ